MYISRVTPSGRKEFLAVVVNVLEYYILVSDL